MASFWSGFWQGMQPMGQNIAQSINRTREEARLQAEQLRQEERRGQLGLLNLFQQQGNVEGVRSVAQTLFPDDVGTLVQGMVPETIAAMPETAITPEAFSSGATSAYMEQQGYTPEEAQAGGPAFMARVREVGQARLKEQQQQTKFDLEMKKLQAEINRLQKDDADWSWDTSNLLFYNKRTGKTKIPDNLDEILKVRGQVRPPKMSPGMKMEVAKIKQIRNASQGLLNTLDDEKAMAKIEPYLGTSWEATWNRMAGTQGGPTLLTWLGVRHEYPQEYNRFTFSMGHLKDYLARKRSGAALNTAEQELYQMLTGEVTYSPATLKTAIQLVMEYMESDAKTYDGDPPWLAATEVRPPFNGEFYTEEEWNSFSEPQQNYILNALPGYMSE